MSIFSKLIGRSKDKMAEELEDKELSSEDRGEVELRSDANHSLKQLKEMMVHNPEDNDEDDLSDYLMDGVVGIEESGVYFQQMPHCGTNFVSQVLYRLKHKAWFAAETLEEFLNIPLDHPNDIEQLHSAKHKFYVVREPFERFLSIYLKNFMISEPEGECPIGIGYADLIGLKYASQDDYETHIQNCFNLIQWIEMNFEGETEEPVRPEWDLLSRKIPILEKNGFVGLTLDGLSWQVSSFLYKEFEEVSSFVSSVAFKNETVSTVDREMLYDTELMEEVYSIYQQDLSHYKKTRAMWLERLLPHFATAAVTLDNEKMITYVGSSDKQIIGLSAYCAGEYELQNIIYAVEYDQPYEFPKFLTATRDSIFQKNSVLDLAHPDITPLFIYRDPVDRFLHIYCTLALYGASGAYSRLASFVEGAEVRLEKYLSEEEHKKNCYQLLHWIEYHYEAKQRAVVPMQFRYQIGLLYGTRTLKSKVIPYPELARYFAELFETDDVYEFFDKLQEYQATENEFIALCKEDETLVKRIREVYASDVKRYNEAVSQYAKAQNKAKN